MSTLREITIHELPSKYIRPYFVVTVGGIRGVPLFHCHYTSEKRDNEYVLRCRILPDDYTHEIGVAQSEQEASQRLYEEAKTAAQEFADGMNASITDRVAEMQTAEKS